MARVKEVYELKYMRDSARAEGKDRIALNWVNKKEPDRTLRSSMTAREAEELIKDLRRALERSAAREIFALGE